MIRWSVALGMSISLGCDPEPSDASESEAGSLDHDAMLDEATPERNAESSECDAYLECFTAHCGELSRSCTRGECTDYLDCASSCEASDDACPTQCIDQRSEGCRDCLADASACAVEHCGAALSRAARCDD